MGSADSANNAEQKLKDKPGEPAPIEHARLLEPYLAAAPNRAVEAARTGENDSKPSRQEWTVAYDLATNLKEKGAYGQMGAEDKINLLKDFVSVTRGTPVTIIAQAIEPKPDAAKPKEGAADSSSKAAKPEDFTLVRYIIRDGIITALPPEKSQGFGQDLTNLLQMATKEAPSLKTALVVNAHGTGNMGLVGDNGKIALSDFESSVKSGLAGSGHEKLDLLDFDSCLMAQDGVLRRTQSIAKHLVASAEIENTDASQGIDGQNLDIWLANLLSNPKMDGAALGKTIINQADKGANNGLSNTSEGTPTLALFNLEAVKPFQQSLDGLGQSLSRAIEKPANLKAVQAVIDSIPVYAATAVAAPGGDNPQARLQKRDLSVFLTRLSTAIDQGKIQDSDGSLKEAIAKTQKQSQAVTEAVHKSTSLMARGNGVFGITAADIPAATSYQETGGLSVFLPESQLLQTEAHAKQKLIASSLLYHCKPDDSVSIRKLNASYLPSAAALVEMKEKDLLSGNTAKTWQETKAAIANLQTKINGSDKDFLKASDAACRITENLLLQPPYQRQIEKYKKELDPSTLYSQEGVGTRGWGKFLQQLKRRSS